MATKRALNMLTCTYQNKALTRKWQCAFSCPRESITNKDSNCLMLRNTSKDRNNGSAVLRFLWVGIVLAWIRYFVVGKLGKFVISSGKKSTEKGSYPIYPMIGWEVTIYHTRTKRSCRIKRTPSEVDP